MNIKNKKFIVGACCSVGLIGILSGFMFVKHENDVKAKESMEIKVENEQIKNAKKSVNTLYSNSKKEDFAKDISMKKIDESKKIVNKLNDKKVKNSLSKELEKIDFMFVTRNSINSLLPDGILKDDVSLENVNQISKNYEKMVSYNKKIAEKSKSILDEISKQFNDNKLATEKTNSLFSDESKNTLADSVTKEMLEEAKNLVETVKNVKLKEELTINFEKASELFEAIQTKEVAKAEEEKENSSSQEQKTNSSNSTNSSGGVSSSNASNSSSASSNGGSGGSAGTSSTGQGQPVQGGIEGLIAQSPTAQYTDQIVGVVASGASAQVYLFEKNGGQWQTVLSTSGMVGSQGVGQASEYRSATPKGSYGLGFAFGTSNPGTKLPFRAITPNSYWISNVNDPQYNTWQERPSSDSADEHLIDYPTQYQYAMTINYNGGVGGGSAFFLHVSNGAPTAGCVAVPQGTMIQLMQRIHSGAHIINVNSQSELANY